MPPAAVGIVLVLKGLTQTGSADVEMNMALTTGGPCKMQLSLDVWGSSGIHCARDRRHPWKNVL